MTQLLRNLACQIPMVSAHMYARLMYYSRCQAQSERNSNHRGAFIHVKNSTCPSDGCIDHPVEAALPSCVISTSLMRLLFPSDRLFRHPPLSRPLITNLPCSKGLDEKSHFLYTEPDLSTNPKITKYWSVLGRPTMLRPFKWMILRAGPD